MQITRSDKEVIKLLNEVGLIVKKIEHLTCPTGAIQGWYYGIKKEKNK